MYFSRKEHEKCEFEVHEVYAIDVLISSGEGKVGFLDIIYLTQFYMLRGLKGIFFANDDTLTCLICMKQDVLQFRGKKLITLYRQP